MREKLPFFLKSSSFLLLGFGAEVSRKGMDSRSFNAAPHFVINRRASQGRQDKFHRND